MASEMKWKVVDATEHHGFYVADAVTDKTVCDLYFANQIAGTIFKYHDDRDHAYLIAAAPDLYAALEQMVEERRDYMRINHLGDPDAQHTVKAANAALAKARGEQP